MLVQLSEPQGLPGHGCPWGQSRDTAHPFLHVLRSQGSLPEPHRPRALDPLAPTRPCRPFPDGHQPSEWSFHACPSSVRVDAGPGAGATVLMLMLTLKRQVGGGSCQAQAGRPPCGAPMQLPVPLPVWLRPVVGPGVCVKARRQTQVSCVGGQCVEAPPPRFPPPWTWGWAQVLVGALSSTLQGGRSGLGSRRRELCERNRVLVSKSHPSDPLRARLQFPQIAPDLLCVL